MSFMLDDLIKMDNNKIIQEYKKIEKKLIDNINTISYADKLLMLAYEIVDKDGWGFFEKIPYFKDKWEQAVQMVYPEVDIKIIRQFIEKRRDRPTSSSFKIIERK